MTQMFQIGVDASEPGKVRLVASMGGKILLLSDKNYPSVNAAFAEFANAITHVIDSGTGVVVDLGEALSKIEELSGTVAYLRGRCDGMASRLEGLE